MHFEVMAFKEVMKVRKYFFILLQYSLFLVNRVKTKEKNVLMCNSNGG